MRKLVLVAAVLGLVLPALVRAGEGEGAGAKEEPVPVTDVVLFSSGVGYFARSGRVTGEEKVELVFKTEQINDLLKSLVVLDLDGGQVSTVSYASQDPTGRALKAFGLDLAGNPSLGNLLTQLRGVKVRVTGPEGELTGTVLSVETKTRKTENGDLVSFRVLNLVTGGGVKALNVDTLRDIRVLDENLNEDITKALAVLARSRDRRKRALSIAFSGKGERRVRVAYILEAPVWKTSYRLLLGEEKPLLQGWAIVENTTDNDWRNVNLSLVSGRPISFVQDLYTPLYLQRPVVRPQLFAGLRPQRYEEGMEGEKKKVLADRDALRRGRYAAKAARSMAPGTPRPAMEAAALGGSGFADMPDGAMANLARSSLAAGAAGGEAGELFRYAMTAPVSIARQSSAMLPIVAEEVAGEKVSIYNAATHAKHPYNGFKLKNTTKLALLAGPVTVFDESVYAGDAQLANLQPGEDRLLSYGLDLACAVERKAEAGPQSLVSVRIVHGTLHSKRKYSQKTVYTLKNKKEAKKAVLVEHPYRHGWTLVTPRKFEERTPALYRFRVALGANDTEKLEVRTERVRSEAVALTNADSDFVGVYLRSRVVSKEVKAALERLVEMKKSLNELTRSKRKIEGDKNRLYKEQSRIRSNLHSVPKNSAIYTRYLKKMGAQEDAIEKLMNELEDVIEAVEAKQKEVNDFLTRLSVE